jgi:hypothetical protein
MGGFSAFHDRLIEEPRSTLFACDFEMKLWYDGT